MLKARTQYLKTQPAPLLSSLSLQSARYSWTSFSLSGPGQLELHLLQVRPASEYLAESSPSTPEPILSFVFQPFLTFAWTFTQVPPPLQQDVSCTTLQGVYITMAPRHTFSLTCSLNHEMPTFICSSPPRPYHTHLNPPPKVTTGETEAKEHR